MHDMDRTNANIDQPPGSGIEAERQARIAWEAERIAEADAELDAGLYVDAGDMSAWIESIGTEQELPPPRTRRR